MISGGVDRLGTISSTFKHTEEEERMIRVLLDEIPAERRSGMVD
jgi:hypothetical protein